MSNKKYYVNTKLIKGTIAKKQPLFPSFNIHFLSQNNLNDKSKRNL